MASLYIHIPFCRHKCLYCDFYSVPLSESIEEQKSLIKKYISALEVEIQMRAEDSRFHKVYETIFIGGGTPSLLQPSEIEKILSALTSGFSIQKDAEVTLETNPGTVDKEKLKVLHSIGVNRISLGIQSFNDNDLRFLSRIHAASDAKKCAEDAYAAGFKNVSFDLIFSLPDQSLQQWKSNLEQAMELRPTHLSCYSLIIEPETPLFDMIQSHQVARPNDEIDADLYEYTIEFLTSHGYEQYEVSNFARENYVCRHNLNYWNQSGYLGFGPSTHSFWKDERWWNIADITEYISRLSRRTFPLSGGEHLTVNQLMEETIFLGLRSNGIDCKQFRKQFNIDFLESHKSIISDLIQQGHAGVDGGRFRLTSKGYMVCDEICQLFH